MLRKIKIFVSYSHKDTVQKLKFDSHLASITRSEDAQVWTDRDILGGQDWAAEINGNLVSADVTILLLSSNFIASEFCYTEEMKTAIGLHVEGKMVIIPVFLSACRIEDLPISKFQTIPCDPLRPRFIESWANTDEAFMHVTGEIKKTIDDYIKKFRNRDIFARKSDIERFIGLGDLERAITELMDFTSNFAKNDKQKWEANTIKGNYYEDELKLERKKYSMTQFRESRKFMLDEIYALIQKVIDDFLLKNVA